ncbi:hypothetical protein [Diplocloster hominis]|uniref:hypothetical protein n=1 Tax=Diplocloster hominis TaxID=3079010 RepID=UPI0031BA190A
MKLIDADAFKEEVAAVAIQTGTVEAASKANVIIQLIDMQPDINNMPRKPVVNKYYYFCPACGSRRTIKQKHNYCHDCGQALDWEN